MGGDTYAISGLIEKRRELSGQVEHYKDKIKAFKTNQFDLRAIKP